MPLRPQTPLIAAVTGLGLLTGGVVSLCLPDSYVSRIVAVYDDQDGALVPWRTERGSPLVAATLAARLTDPDFLWQVGHETELTRTRPAGGALTAYLRTHVPLGTHLFAAPEGKELPDDSHNKARLAAWLGPHLTPRFDGASGVLELTATADDPLLAKRLAETAMEQLIQGELTREAEALGRSRDADEAWLKAHPVAGETARLRAEASAGDRAAASPLHTRELELLDRIQVAKGELDQLKARTSARRATLETELARLKTRLEPSHPDVIAKKAELRALARDPGERVARVRLEELQGELAKLREQQRRGAVGPGAAGAVALAGPGPGASGQLGSPTGGGDEAVGEAAPELARTLAGRAAELGLESDRLAQQADDQAVRTRLRVVAPATYDDEPRGKGRAAVCTLGFGLIGLAAGLGLGKARERRRPLGAGPDGLARALGLPLLGVLPGVDGAAGAVAARRLELMLRRHLRGNTLLLETVGEAARSGHALGHWLTVIGTETALTGLLIDCDPRDPVVPATARGDGPADFAAFLAGKAPWKEARLARTAERPFDLMALAPEAAVGESAPLGRLYRPETLEKLFQGLGRSYGRVYVRGHGPEQILETAALGQAATDVVLVVDAARTSEAEARQAAALADPEKLRGLVVIQA